MAPSPVVLLAALCVAAATRSGAQPARPEAYATFVEALELRDAGQIVEALKTLRRAAAQDPKSADIRAEIARTLRDQARFDEAMAEARAARELAPNRADLRLLAGQIRQFEGQTGGGVGPLREAAREYEEAARLDPSDLGPLRDLTRVYAALRDPAGALSAWKRLSDLDPLNADASIQVAQLSMATGDAPGALKALEAAAATRPDNARVQALLGDVKSQTGRAAEAEAHYSAAARLDPGDLASRLKLGEGLLASGRAAEAAKIGEEILGLDPKNRFALDLAARAYKESGRMAEALETARRLAESDPRDPKSGFLLVTILEARGEFAEAETRLEGLLKRDRRSEKPEDGARTDRALHAHLGLVRQQLGRFADAAESFGAANASGAARDPELIGYRLDALLAARAFTTALDESRSAAAEFPNATPLRFAEAHALRGLGRSQEASKAIDALVARQPADIEVLLSAGDFHQRTKDHRRAEEFFRRALAQDSKSARAAFGLGAVLERLTRYDEAESHFRKVLELAPRASSAMNYLGYMNANRNVRVAEALALIERALEIEPANGAYLDSRGWALFRLGRFAEAEKDIRRALETQRDNAVVLGHMGHVLEALGRVPEAIDFWTRALQGEDEDGELDRGDVEARLKKRSR